MRWLAAIGVGAIFGLAVWGDEGTLPDGRRLNGDVRWQPNGRLYLDAAGRSLRLDQFANVRLSGPMTGELSADAAFRVQFGDDEQLSGVQLSLDADTLRLRTGWPKELRLPRVAVSAVVPLPAQRSPETAASQDTIVLAGGDRLFGRITHADSTGATLVARFGTHNLPWREIQAIVLRGQAAPLGVSEGEHVRVDFLAGLGAAVDRLDGVVTGLDDRQLSLRHRHLGDITLERGRVRRLYWQFFGQRQDVANGWHRLGGDLLPLERLPPDRLNLKQSFTLKTVRANTHLLLRVANLPGPGDGIEVARAVDRGMQTQVWLNGRRVDALNRLGGRSSAQPRWLRLDLAKDLLRVGENVVELRLTPDPKSGRYGTCDVSGMMLEIPGETQQ